MNTFGRVFRLTSFGESHGPAIGGVIDGLPSGVVFDMSRIREQLYRRRPGSSSLVTSRQESDTLCLLSGLMGCDADGNDLSPLSDSCSYVVSLGTPVGFMTRNSDCRSADYDELRHIYRPSHADYAWDRRYKVRDWRGGGRASGRETFSRVVAGAFARQILESEGISITSCIACIGNMSSPSDADVERMVTETRNAADSIGGIVECRVSGVPAGIGDPVFGKLQQLLASAMMSIGGIKGFEYGMGFEGVRAYGSERADEILVDDSGQPYISANHSGGIQGGISNGCDIVMRLAVKPTPTIGRELRTITDNGDPVKVKAVGRHDPSILLRVPVVAEAMAAMVILDCMLMRRIG